MKDILSGTIPKALVGLFALIEFATTAEMCDDMNSCPRRFAWGVAVGVISFVFVAIQLALDVFVPNVGTRIDWLNSLFHAIWWAIGTGLLTGNGDPHQGVGNGYYSTWGAFLFSIVWMIDAFTTKGWALPKVTPAKKREEAVAEEVEDVESGGSNNPAE